MYDLMEDYLETWTVVRGHIRRKTRTRNFLFKDTHDYEEWLNSLANHAIADALANLAKWDRNFPFHSFVFLRARDLIRKDLLTESKFLQTEQACLVAERHQRQDDDPWEEFLEREDTDALLRQLSEDQSEAVSLHYLIDLSIKETAKLMERTPGSVKTLLHRARAKLLEHLKTHDPITYSRLQAAHSRASQEPSPAANVISLSTRRSTT